MSHGYVSYSFVILVVTTRITHKVSCIHIGVRLRVARFDDMGNARALMSEASNRCMASRFFLLLMVIMKPDDTWTI